MGEENFNIKVYCKECNKRLLLLGAIPFNKVLVRIRFIEEGLTNISMHCPNHPGRLFTFVIMDNEGESYPKSFFKPNTPNNPNLSTVST